VDVLVRDAYRAHHALRGERLDARTAEAAELLATVTGQDIEETSDGRFRIFEGTAPDRVISTVDPQARHGHKTAAHGFDGYKAHVAVDPDSEVICAAEVSPAATGDATVVPTLLGDLTPGQGEPAARAVVYGDSAYGTAANLTWLNQHGLTPMVRTQLPTPPGGRFGKGQFQVDLQARTVTCPARVTVAITPAVAVVAGPDSARRAASALCGMAALPAPAAGWSPSIPARPSWPPPASASASRPGGPTTGRLDRGWSASSPTYCAAATAAAAPGSEGWCASARTGSC
jgi:Transposase DDE domain